MMFELSISSVKPCELLFRGGLWKMDGYSIDFSYLCSVVGSLI